MTFSYTRHLGLLLLCFGCALPLVAQRDTIQIRGQAFVLVTEEVVGNDDLQRQVHLLRLEGGRAKWLLRHTLLAESADCNSIALELGGYAVSDTGITFYTTWMHTAQALAGVCGVRKQDYRITDQGRLVQGERRCWVWLASAHPCLQGLESSQEAMLSELVPASVAADRRVFVACLEQEFGAQVASVSQRDALKQAVEAALATSTALAMRRQTEDLKWMLCK
jgi:hypothetical protein